MNSTQIALRYQALFDDMKRRMNSTGKWRGLPALLDEMHALRCAHRAALVPLHDAQCAELESEFQMALA